MLCLKMKSTNAVLGINIKHLKMNMNYDDAKLSTEYIPPKSGVVASAVVVEIKSISVSGFLWDAVGDGCYS